MEKVEEKLEEITKKYKILQKHSNFQIRNFMIGKELTENAKIWQCIRELNSRSESLNSLIQEIELLNDNIELQKIEIEKTELNEIKTEEHPRINELNLLTKKITIKKQVRELFNMENNLKKLNERKISILSECKEIIEIFNELLSKNDFVEFDNEKAQIEFWNTKMSNELNLHAMLGMPPSLELLKSTLALPDTCDTKINMTKALLQNTRRIIEKKNSNGN